MRFHVRLYTDAKSTLRQISANMKVEPRTLKVEPQTRILINTQYMPSQTPSARSQMYSSATAEPSEAAIAPQIAAPAIAAGSS